ARLRRVRRHALRRRPRPAHRHGDVVRGRVPVDRLSAAVPAKPLDARLRDLPGCARHRRARSRLERRHRVTTVAGTVRAGRDMSLLVSTPRSTAQLAEIPLFAGLDAESLERIAAIGTTVSLPAGRVIIERGQPGAGLYVVEDGIVSVELR